MGHRWCPTNISGFCVRAIVQTEEATCSQCSVDPNERPTTNLPATVENRHTHELKGSVFHCCSNALVRMNKFGEFFRARGLTASSTPRAHGRWRISTPFCLSTCLASTRNNIDGTGSCPFSFPGLSHVDHSTTLWVRFGEDDTTDQNTWLRHESARKFTQGTLPKGTSVTSVPIAARQSVLADFGTRRLRTQEFSKPPA